MVLLAIVARRERHPKRQRKGQRMKERLEYDLGCPLPAEFSAHRQGILCLLYLTSTHSLRPLGSCPGLVTFLLFPPDPLPALAPPSPIPSCAQRRCLMNEAEFQLLAATFHSRQRNLAYRKMINCRNFSFLENNPLERAKGGSISVFITPLSGSLLIPVNSNEILLIITKKEKGRKCIN